MASFSTKTKAIILSTLLICNKYSALGDKITFFEPVYANDTNTVIIPKEKITTIVDSSNIVKNLNLIQKPTIEPHECDQAILQLEGIMSTAKNFIPHNKINILNKNVYSKKLKDKTPRAELQSEMIKTIKIIENNNKQSKLKDVENLYSLASRFKQKIERKSKGNSKSNASTLDSTYSCESYSGTNDDDFLHTADLSTTSTNTQDPSSIQTINPDEQQNQNSDQHAQVVSEEHAPEIQNVDATARQTIGLQEVETQAELQAAEPDLLEEQDNNDNGYIADSETDDEEEQVDNNDVLPAASTTASSNYSDNQTQSSDSDIQSTTEDDTGLDRNDDDFTTVSQPVSNNNTAMIHDTDDNNHGQFTPTLHSTIYKARTLVFPQISRKVSSDRTTQQAIGASCSSNLKILKRYELEAKYLYSTTTTPKTNGGSKSNIHGLLINLKRQMTSKFTAGVFYSPTTTNTTSLNNNDNNTSGCVDHLFGAYTSYAITPVTYLSNQIALGITSDDNNKSSNEKYHNYLIFDSFISHKINIDATKIVSPELGISYYQSNTHIPSDVGQIKNLSLNMGIKLQYKYKYNNFDLCPSIKINHVHPLYANITGNTKDLSNRSDTPSIDLLRDLQSAFDPHSSVRLALSVRHKSIRFEGGYGFTAYHNIEHSYAHTFFAKLNLSL